MLLTLSAAPMAAEKGQGKHQGRQMQKCLRTLSTRLKSSVSERYRVRTNIAHGCPKSRDSGAKVGCSPSLYFSSNINIPACQSSIESLDMNDRGHRLARKKLARLPGTGLRGGKGHRNRSEGEVPGYGSADSNLTAADRHVLHEPGLVRLRYVPTTPTPVTGTSFAPFFMRPNICSM